MIHKGNNVEQDCNVWSLTLLLVTRYPESECICIFGMTTTCQFVPGFSGVEAK